MSVDFVQRLQFEFIEAFEAPLDKMFWLKLIEEETKELLDAIRDGDRANALKEAVDLSYVILGSLNSGVGDDPEDDEDQYIMMVLEEAEAATEAYWRFEKNATEATMMEAFLRVHRSNMSKLGDDGKPIRREDGKIMKGPNYVPPVLDDLLPEEA